MSIDHYVARLSASQNANFAVNDHIEFDTEAGVGGLASVSTGAGQANGIFTINETGIYVLSIFVFASAVNGSFTIVPRTAGDVDITDATGQILRVYSDDNVGTDATEAAGHQTIFQFTAGDTLKFALETSINITLFIENGTAFSLLKLA